MLERLTESAKQVLVKAQGEARDLNHPYIGTEHILLGLATVKEGRAFVALFQLDVEAESVRQMVVRKVGKGKESYEGQIPFKPSAKAVLELGMREALSLGHNHIDTGHILLGLSRVEPHMGGSFVAPEILRELDATEGKIRVTTIQVMNDEPREP